MFATPSAVLIATIAGTALVLSGVVIWARNRQRRITRQDLSQRPR